MIEVVAASPAHVGTVAARMREIDRLECRIMGHTPKAALRASLMNSRFAWTAKVDGRAEAMFGVSTVSLLGDEGSPWLLLTADAMRHHRAILTIGQRYSDLMLTEYGVLRNNVHADNSAAIRWLGRLGFTIGPVFDMNGHTMRPIERRAGE